MSLKSIRTANLKGKRVLLRLDLNSSIEKAKIKNFERLNASIKTLKYLKNNQAITVVLAHQSRPGEKDFTSLKLHANYLNRKIKVKFVNDIIGDKAINAVKLLKPGDILLLDNIRKLREEFRPNANYSKKLARRFDIYVNDAFSVSHRNHASIVDFPRLLPSYIGLNFEQELNALNKIKVKNALFVLGGVKSDDDVKILKNNKVLVGGLFSQLCLIAKGYNLGKENKIVKKDLKLIKKIKPRLKNIILPIDVAILKNNKRVELKVDQLPVNNYLYDIGSDTIKLYIKRIKKARAIYVKGPLGLYEDKRFALGTKAIFKAVASSKAFSVIFGGNTIDALDRFKINKNKINYISLSGGALLTYLSGEKLPGLEALKSKFKAKQNNDRPATNKLHKR